MMKNLLLNLKALAVATFLLATLAASADVTIWVYYDDDNTVFNNNGIGDAYVYAFANEGDNNGINNVNWPGTLLTNHAKIGAKNWYWFTITGVNSCHVIFNNGGDANHNNVSQAPTLTAKEGDNYYYYTGSLYAINLTPMKEAVDAGKPYFIFEEPTWWRNSYGEADPNFYAWKDGGATNNGGWPGPKMQWIGGKNSQTNHNVYGASTDFVPENMIFTRTYYEYNEQKRQEFNVLNSGLSVINRGYYEFGVISDNKDENDGNLHVYNYYTDVIFPTMVTASLAQLEASPSNYTNKVVTISDALTVGGLVGSTIYAHDAVNVAEAAPSGAIDYNNSVLHFDNSVQNNWIAINGVSNADENYTLTGVTGVLSDVDNFSFDASVYTVNEQAGSPTLNTYIPCNFTGTQTINGKTYFFAKPQVMEYANIYAAVYNGGTSFLVPEKQVVNGTQINGAELQGGFNVASVSGYNLIQGTMYKFPAVIKKTANGGQAPRRVAGTNGNYSVEIAGNPQAEGIATAVTDVRNAGEVAGVKYVNVAGQVSSTPWQGVNIVVTRMSDGTTRTAKVVK